MFKNGWVLTDSSKEKREVLKIIKKQQQQQQQKDCLHSVLKQNNKRMAKDQIKQLTATIPAYERSPESEYCELPLIANS